MTDADALVTRWLRAEVRAAAAYAVPDAAGCIKLDAMENPWGWPQALRADWLAALAAVAVNRYPDPQARGVVQALRKAGLVPDGCGVLLGNGSDELIQILLQGVAEPGRAVLAPEPTFVMYRLLALWTGLQYISVPLRRDDYALDAAAMREAIRRHQPALVFLACPNNPTGNLFDAGVIEEILRTSPGLVVVDEAYLPFAETSFADRLQQYPNLLILRTLSKLGLAGLRLGYLLGAPALIEPFDKLRLPYNINALTQASVSFMLSHVGVLDEQAAQIRAERERLAQSLRELPGSTVYPSRANFILLRVPSGCADTLHAGLKAAGILIKNLHAQGGPLADCLRVTVGTPAENVRFLAELNRLWP